MIIETNLKVQLQSECDPDSLMWATSAEYGLFSQKEHPTGLQCQNLLHGFKKYIVYLLASLWTQTHLQMQSFIQILLQNLTSPINLTTKNVNADRNLFFCNLTIFELVFAG